MEKAVDLALVHMIQLTISCFGCCPCCTVLSACWASAKGMRGLYSEFEPVQSGFAASFSVMPLVTTELKTSGSSDLMVVGNQN
jgi:hypothetical protein